jgi:pimeloyl-ACP methyl ester carboxylesterase
VAAFRERRVAVNGIEMHVLEAGRRGDPLVILSHGFPEGAWSWRHQLGPLADAGYHVIAPDQRGYGRSSLPTEVRDYGITQLTGDLVGLIEQAGHEQAVLVGHDWGALIAWDMARLHPQRLRAVVGVSVPYVQWPAPPTQLFQMAYGDRFFYMTYFQTVGPAEHELEADVRTTMATVLWGASGEGFRPPTEQVAAAGTGFLTQMPTPPPLPWSWLDEAELARYVDAFEHSGFFGPISYYRNLDANYELVKDLASDRISMPSYYIGGSADPVLVMDPNGIERMSVLPDFRGHVLIDGCGHWTQQERPAEFNAALLGFLATLD